MLNVDINFFQKSKKTTVPKQKSKKVDETINSLHNNTYKIKQHETKHTQRVISNTEEMLDRSCFKWCHLHELFLTAKEGLKSNT